MFATKHEVIALCAQEDRDWATEEDESEDFAVLVKLSVKSWAGQMERPNTFLRQSKKNLMGSLP